MKGARALPSLLPSSSLHLLPPCIALVGPTASGKSSVAFDVARNYVNVEIVSLDSMQVYRHMDIGTAKPTVHEQEQVRHHMIDMINPDELFALGEFVRMAREVVQEIAARNSVPLLVGGTGMYAHSLIDGFDVPPSFPEIRATLEAEAEHDVAALYAELVAKDPQAATKMEPNNQRRIVRALEVVRGSGRKFSSFGSGVTAFGPTNVCIFGLDCARDELDMRIAARTAHMCAAGLVNEVRTISRMFQWSRTAAQAIGYKEVLARLDDLAARDDAAAEVAGADAVNAAGATQRACTLPYESETHDAIAAEITLHTRQLARRQQRWFRRDQRITWLSVNHAHDVLCAQVESMLT